MLPLHWACRQNASFTIIERLLRANPEAVEKKDQWGRTPITLIEDNNHPEKNLVLKALHRDPSFWAGNFVDDIEKLKADVEQVPNDKVGKYELENAMLKEKIRDMVTMNNYNDEDIEKIHQENKDLVNQVRQLKSQLNNFVEIMRGIDEQRKALIEVADKMEESLKMASDIAGGS
jgi:cell division protein FtsB